MGVSSQSSQDTDIPRGTPFLQPREDGVLGDDTLRISNFEGLASKEIASSAIHTP